jgi:hypothetical protein
MVLTVALAAPDALAVGAASAPSIRVTHGPYHDGQLINVSVGPNRFFKPYSKVNILECADPGGKPKNLPTSESSCDGNTVQGETILVAKNGSFSERGYEIYALPNVRVLGELPTGQPVCNQKRSCVLYIGENETKFSAPKEFSAPFTIRKSGPHSK